MMNWKDLLIIFPVALVSVFFLFFGAENWDYLSFLPRLAVVFTCIIGTFILLLKSDELTTRAEKLDELRSLEGVTDIRIPFFNDAIEFEYLHKPVHLKSNLLLPKFALSFGDKGRLHCELYAEDIGPDINYLKDEALREELDHFVKSYGLIRLERKNGKLFLETIIDVDLEYNREKGTYSNIFILDSLRLVHHLRERD